jgi:hypothetical protein
MQTCFGEVASPDGAAWDRVFEPGIERPELRMRAWSSPAGDYAGWQSDEALPISYGHGGEVVGELVFLDRSGANGSLLGVGHISDDVGPFTPVQVYADEPPVIVRTPLFFSSETLRDPDDGTLLLAGVAITASPARVSARTSGELTFLPGRLDFRQVADERWHLRQSSPEHGLLTRAAVSYLDHQPLYVHDPAGDAGQRAWRESQEGLHVSPGKGRSSQLPGGLRKAGAIGRVLDVR